LFRQAVLDFADPGCFARETLTDGALEAEQIDLPLVEALESQVWGQGFPAPLFSDTFEVGRQSLMAGKHLRIELRSGTRKLTAVAFGRTEPLPSPARIAYRLIRDEFQGLASVRLVIETVEAAAV